MMRFETRFTCDFIRRVLPPDCARILEVGCGSGELAACLRQDGFQVTAIDRDLQVVSAARRLGVDARLAEWPDFDDGRLTQSSLRVRCIIFTRCARRSRALSSVWRMGDA